MAAREWGVCVARWSDDEGWRDSVKRGKPFSVVRDKDGTPTATGAAERPGRAEAEDAVRTLIRWAGDDVGREGLRDTPPRLVRAYE